MISFPLTYLIIGITVFVSWRAFDNSALFEKLLNNPYRIKHQKQYYRLLSHALIHADWMHLLFNMYVFYSFGLIMESVFIAMWGKAAGSLLFLILYIGGALVAALPSQRKHGDNFGYNSVGASGAVSAVLMSYMILFPTQEVLFFFAIPMPSFVAVIIFFALEFFLNRSGKTGIAHDAHIWGALFGIFFWVIIQPATIVNFFVLIGAKLGLT